MINFASSGRHDDLKDTGNTQNDFFSFIKNEELIILANPNAYSMKKLSLLLFILLYFTTHSWSYSDNDSVKTYLLKGLEAKSEHRFLVAINNFNKAIFFDSTNTEVLIALGETFAEMRQYAAAINAFEKLYQLDSYNTKAVENLANLYFLRRKSEMAIFYAEKMRKMKIGAGRPDYIIGMISYYDENYPVAVENLMNYLNYEPDNAEVTYAIGRSYVDLERYDNAIRYYEKSISLDSSSPMRIYELGMIYYNISNYGKAVEYFELAGARGLRQDIDYFVNLGNVYVSSGKAEKGIELLKKALEKRASNPSILNDLAYAFYYNKNYQEAIDTWDQILQMDKTNARSLYMIGICYQKRGEKAKGQILCDKAIALDPSLNNLKRQVGGLGL
ncbi:MAG TPA: tetratricopeptide repeat protein [Chitinophagaceae bacterium]|nr:tetratricopeptide repeat protein [Chitinophagaceae bacterium]